MKALEITQNLFKIAKKTAQNQVQAIQMLAATPEFLGKIGYYLQEKPNTWLVPPIESDWYHRMRDDISDVLPDLIDENVLLFAHSGYRWILIKASDRVLPFVFVDRGGVAHLINLIIGHESNWIQVFEEELSKMLATGSYGGTRLVLPTPEVSPELLKGPIRDPKWGVTGVFFE